MEQIEPGVYKHFKGRFSEVYGVAKHSDRDEVLVIYRGLNDGGFYARPIESFMEMVDNKNGEKVPRFTKATQAELEQLKKENLLDKSFGLN